MLTYRLLHFFKFTGVALFSGGLIASLVARDPADRKRAVHVVASPGLLITWITGYLLSLMLNTSLVELWILGGIGFSVISQGALVRSVSREGSVRGERITAAVALVIVLGFMAFRPTWGSLR